MTFDGIWYHSAVEQEVIDSILGDGGWQPKKVRNTIYGTAIYLSNCNWYNDKAADFIIACELDIQPSQMMSTFDATTFNHDLGIGETAKHLRGYLRTNGIPAYINGVPGDHIHNLARQTFFLELGKRAIRFTEYGVPVIAVYDPTAIVNARRIAKTHVPDCPVAAI